MKTTGLVAGGVAAGGVGLLTDVDGLGNPEREVLKVVSKYGNAVKQVKNDDGGFEFTVQMNGMDQFSRVFCESEGNPFEKIYAEGNSMKFVHRGVPFTLQNVA